MRYYTIHEPPDPPVDRIDRADSLLFIGDGFTPAAAAFGPLWLLANRLWLAFAGYIGAIAVLGFIVVAADLGPRWVSLMLGAFNLVLGFEAASLKRWALERRGWRTLGTVSGRTVDECERRFLETWLHDQRLSREAEFVSMVNALRASGAGPAGAFTGDAVSSGGSASRRTGWLRWRTAR